MSEKDVEDMKEFMTVLMDVKVSMAELNGKVDKIISLEEKVNATYDIAKEAERTSSDNKTQVNHIQKNKADKDDVERIVNDKDNWKRNFPAYAAVIVAIIALFF